MRTHVDSGASEDAVAGALAATRNSPRIHNAKRFMVRRANHYTMPATEWVLATESCKAKWISKVDGTIVYVLVPIYVVPLLDGITA